MTPTLDPVPAALKTQADFEAALAAGNYDFSGWHFGETITIRDDHSGKDFNFYKVKIEGDLYARAATFRNLDARAATFRNLDARAARFNDLYASDATFRNLDARAARFNDLDASAARFNDLDASAARFRMSNFSNAKWMKRVSPIQYLEDHFEETERGYIVYKSFGQQYQPNPNWKIEPDSVIEEIVDTHVAVDCGSGINVATREWITRNLRGPRVWKCLIEWKWLPGVIVPWKTDGKIRCERLRLLEIVE